MAGGVIASGLLDLRFSLTVAVAAVAVALCASAIAAAGWQARAWRSG